MTISKDSVVVAVKSQVSCQLDAETVVLHYDKGLYFGLNEVGTLIWKQVQHPRKVQKNRDAILREYEVSNERCERELLTLLGELSENGSVQFAMRWLHK
jgi:coenzyme PQQ synthesis protein D (PqqD)